MDLKQLLNDFKQVYEEPEIGNITIGFSSIDPQKKKPSSSGGGTDDHEQLQNLWGGDSTGHYHMNSVEWHCLQALALRLYDASTGQVNIPTGGGTNDHEQLQNLWGGDMGGHYHLSENEYVKLRVLLQQILFDTNWNVIIPASLIDSDIGGSGCTCDPNNLTDAQKQIVDDKIDAAIQNLLNNISPLSLTASDTSIVASSGETKVLTLTASGIDDLTVTCEGSGLNITVTEVS